jgi:hypothetical protein
VPANHVECIDGLLNLLDGLLLRDVGLDVGVWLVEILRDLRLRVVDTNETELTIPFGN